MKCWAGFPKWEKARFSDPVIDLALVGRDLDWRTIGRIYDALDDQLLPYGFSVIRQDENTDPDVNEHIARVGVPVFARESAAGRS